MCGILLIDKPPGVTSHDVINEVRRRLGIRRVGHAGTLDPICSGLLVIAIGPATRLLRFLPLEPKEYEGVMKLGEATDTQDAEGAVIQSADASHLTLEALVQEAGHLVGEVEQLPPMYSAVKVAGKKLYEYARAGKAVEREPRTVTIYRFDVTSLEAPLARFWVRCSGGTYVRTLVHDLGERLGVGAHVVELRRTVAGMFRVEDAVPIKDVDEAQLIPPEEALDPMPMVRLPRPLAEVASHGGIVRVPHQAPGKYLGLLDPEGHLIAVACETERGWQPEVVLPRGTSVRN